MEMGMGSHRTYGQIRPGTLRLRTHWRGQLQRWDIMGPRGMVVPYPGAEPSEYCFRISSYRGLSPHGRNMAKVQRLAAYLRQHPRMDQKVLLEYLETTGLKGGPRFWVQRLPPTNWAMGWEDLRCPQEEVDDIGEGVVGSTPTED